MSVLSTIQSACLRLDLSQPSVVFNSTDREWQEMADMANTCARYILREYDWQKLKAIGTITGDGTATSFTLPSDYARMTKDSNLTGSYQIYNTAQQVLNLNDWLTLTSDDTESWQQSWSVFGGNINVIPALPLAETLRYFYLRNSIANNTASRFTADSDVFTLDEDLLRLCIIWQWKAAKGQEYSNELQDYQDALSHETFNDGGARQSIISGRGYRFQTGQHFP